MKKSKIVLVSAIIGTLYMIYIISYFLEGLAAPVDEAEALGAAVATALVAPHMFVLVVAVIMNWIGFFLNAKWAVLTGAILYTVSGFLFLLYVVFELPSIILSFIGYGKMKKNVPVATESVAV